MYTNTFDSTAAPVFHANMDMTNVRSERFKTTVERALIPDAEVSRFYDLDLDGTERRYFSTNITADQIELDFVGKLPCSIDWCAGHESNEAHTWNDLHHQGADRRTALVDDVSGIDIVFCRISALETGSGIWLALQGDVEIDLDEAEAVADRLDLAAEELRAFAAATRAQEKVNV
jgi:hypothetical protein